MGRPSDLLERGEEFASSDAVVRFAMEAWRDPDVGARFEQRPAETLAEFGVELPQELAMVPLGTGQIGMPGPDFVPFRITLSRCRTVVVRDPETKRLKTETVCFGFEIVPTPIPGGPIA